MRLEEIADRLAAQQYIADRKVVMAVYLAVTLGKPLLLEGPAGVGKTALATAMAAALDTELIRLQCYEGLDAAAALYEWNFPKQMLRIKLEEQSSKSIDEKESVIFSRPFLLERPVLRALSNPDHPPVLLIDEVDRADEEFEALLLEVLSEFQVTIPEMGTVKAKHRPIVILTSNRIRELSEALRRRCLYHWVDYPTAEQELAIVNAQVPGLDERLAAEVVAYVQRVRTLNLEKAPGVAETLDWVSGLVALGASRLDPAVVEETLGLLLKARADINQMCGGQFLELLQQERR